MRMFERFDSFSDSAFDADHELRKMKSSGKPEESEHERSGKEESKKTEQLTTELQNDPNGFLSATESVAISMTGSVHQELRQYHLNDTPEGAEIQSAMKHAESEFLVSTNAIISNPELTPEEKTHSIQQAMDSFAREIGGLR